MQEIKSKITGVLIVLLLISLWGNFRNYNRLNDLQYDINKVSNNLEHRINDINRSVSDTLNEFKRETMWVRESSFDIVRFSEDLDEATLKIRMDLNEKQKGEKLVVVANSIKGEEKLEFELPESSDLTYQLEITLPVKEYALQLLGESNGNLRSDLLERIDLSSYKNGIMSIDAEIIQGTYDEKEEEGYYSFFVAVDQMLKGEKMFAEYLTGLEITDITADVYMDNEYINTIDFLNEKNYLPMDIKDLGRRIPESAISTFHPAEYERKHFFSGRYAIKGIQNFDFSGIVFHIQVKDNKGNTYHEFMGEGPYDYKKMIEEKSVQ
ncbi:MAG: hypothetical protein WC996_05590 [Peptostreptococcales bacterium]